MRSLFDITIKIELLAPYLIHSAAPGQYGFDASVLRNHLNHPIIPGTLLAGRIGQVFEQYGSELGNASRQEWFGREGVDTTEQRHRSRIRTADLSLQSPARSHQRSRTEINDDTGAVVPAALQTIEQVNAAGALLTFEGVWHVWASTEEAALLEKQLLSALLMQSQIGAYRGIGFGVLHSASVVLAESNANSFELLPSRALHSLALRFDDPICVASRTTSGNTFESNDIIPGAAILGAIATTLIDKTGLKSIAALAKTGNKLAEHFNLLRCLNAHPTRAGAQRPVPLAQSVVITHDNAVGDVFAQATAPALSEGSDAPRFQTDWKERDYTLLGKNWAWGQTQTCERVRTSIENGQALDASLFTVKSRYLTPEYLRDESAADRWVFSLDLRQVPPGDLDAVTSELNAILQFGLAPVGKTDATGILSNEASAAASELQLPDSHGLVRVQLVSDAWLFATDEVAEKADINLLSIYANAFAHIGGSAADGLELSHFFATQRLAGGEFYFRRSGNETYQPQVITERGSIFMFKVTDSALAKSTLTRWQNQGLPIPPSLLGSHNWATCPFLPTVGFGEVLINPPLLTRELALPAEQAQ
jgi:CRISPR/Cas system CSM-associated protein Csm3 (group 7 of RAMP superfamily)